MKADVYQIFLLPIKFRNCCFCGASEAPAHTSTSACCSSCAEDWCRLKLWSHMSHSTPDLAFLPTPGCPKLQVPGQELEPNLSWQVQPAPVPAQGSSGPMATLCNRFPWVFTHTCPSCRNLKLTDSLPASPHQTPVLEELSPHTPTAADGSCSKSSAIMKIQPSAALLGMEMAYPVMNMKSPGSGSGL